MVISAPARNQAIPGPARRQSRLTHAGSQLRGPSSSPGQKLRRFQVESLRMRTFPRLEQVRGRTDLARHDTLCYQVFEGHGWAQNIGLDQFNSHASKLRQILIRLDTLPHYRASQRPGQGRYGFHYGTAFRVGIQTPHKRGVPLELTRAALY